MAALTTGMVFLRENYYYTCEFYVNQIYLCMRGLHCGKKLVMGSDTWFLVHMNTNVFNSSSITSDISGYLIN